MPWHIYVLSTMESRDGVWDDLEAHCDLFILARRYPSCSRYVNPMMTDLCDLYLVKGLLLSLLDMVVETLIVILQHQSLVRYRQNPNTMRTRSTFGEASVQ